MQRFVNYLKKYLFKINASAYNYEDFINYKGANNELIMDKILFY